MKSASAPTPLLASADATSGWEASRPAPRHQTGVFVSDGANHAKLLIASCLMWFLRENCGPCFCRVKDQRTSCKVWSTCRRRAKPRCLCDAKCLKIIRPNLDVFNSPLWPCFQFSAIVMELNFMKTRTSIRSGRPFHPSPAAEAGWLLFLSGFNLKLILNVVLMVI